MTPSETLRAAAERLRAMAAKATEGPWAWDGASVDVEPTTRGAFVAAGGDHFDILDGDGAWIATMSPVVAEPLARELEMHFVMLRTIEDLDGARSSMGKALGVERAQHMLAFARSILEQP